MNRVFINIRFVFFINRPKYRIAGRKQLSLVFIRKNLHIRRKSHPYPQLIDLRGILTQDNNGYDFIPLVSVPRFVNIQ